MMRAWPSSGSFKFREKNMARLIWRRCVNGKQTVGCCRQIPPARPMSTRLIGKRPATFLACFESNHRRCKDQPEINDQPYAQGSGEPKEISDQKSKSRPPSRNILVETFRIYFRGFFQFFCLSLLSIVPIVCAELTSRFIDTAPGVNVDLRTLVIVAFGLCMLILRIVLIPIYIAGIQILTAELATGHRIGFFSVLNAAVKYWPRVAGLGLFVYGVFFLLILFALGIAIMVVTSAALFSIVLALGLLAFQVWLFGRFFINVLFWQQFTVLENANTNEALRESRRLARSGRDLPWYQRPLWRGALIVSLWVAFVLAITITPAWPMLRDYFVELTRTQDPQALLQKMNASLQTHGVNYPVLALSILQRILQPLLGIAFVVL